MAQTGAARVQKHRVKQRARIMELEAEVIELTRQVPPPLRSDRRMTKAVAELSEEWIGGGGGFGVGLDTFIGGVAFGIELMKGLDLLRNPGGCSIDEALSRMCGAMLANKVSVGTLSTCKTGAYIQAGKWREDHGGDKQYNEEINLARQDGPVTGVQGKKIAP